MPVVQARMYEEQQQADKSCYWICTTDWLFFRRILSYKTYFRVWFFNLYPLGAPSFAYRCWNLHGSLSCSAIVTRFVTPLVVYVLTPPDP